MVIKFKQIEKSRRKEERARKKNKMLEQKEEDNTILSTAVMDIPKIDILERKNTIIIASSHLEDDKVVVPALIKVLGLYPDWNILYVPHELDIDPIEKIKTDFNKEGVEPTLHTGNQEDIPDEKVVIIRSIGLLANLYWKSKITNQSLNFCFY